MLPNLRRPASIQWNYQRQANTSTQILALLAVATNNCGAQKNSIHPKWLFFGIAQKAGTGVFCRKPSVFPGSVFRKGDFFGRVGMLVGWDRGRAKDCDFGADGAATGVPAWDPSWA